MDSKIKWNLLKMKYSKGFANKTINIVKFYGCSCIEMVGRRMQIKFAEKLFLFAFSCVWIWFCEPQHKSWPYSWKQTTESIEFYLNIMNSNNAIWAKFRACTMKVWPFRQRKNNILFLFLSIYLFDFLNCCCFIFSVWVIRFDESFGLFTVMKCMRSIL